MSSKHECEEKAKELLARAFGSGRWLLAALVVGQESDEFTMVTCEFPTKAFGKAVEQFKERVRMLEEEATGIPDAPPPLPRADIRFPWMKPAVVQGGPKDE